MFASTFQFTVAAVAPALSRALYDLAVHAQYGADLLEQWAGQLARAARDAAAPVPQQPERVVHEVLTIRDLFRRAKDEGRAVYAP